MPRNKEGYKMDMSKPREYVKHPEHGLKMIYESDYEEYAAQGWYRPDEEPKVKQEVKESVVSVPDINAEEKSFDDVKNDASELSAWLNQKYGLETNHRIGLKKLIRLAEHHDNSTKDN